MQNVGVRPGHCSFCVWPLKSGGGGGVASRLAHVVEVEKNILQGTERVSENYAQGVRPSVRVRPSVIQSVLVSRHACPTSVRSSEL